MVLRTPSPRVRQAPGWGPALVVLAVLAEAMMASLAAADTGRWWVSLPRAASGIETLDHRRAAPVPTSRALERRARRGDPARIPDLTRGPDPMAVQSLEAAGARIVRISRWLSAASVEADPSVRARLTRRFGPAALRPVRSGRVELPRDREVRAEPLLPRRRDDDAFDYGLSRPQLAQIGVDRLHARGLTGRDVRVLVLDTGYRLTHPALEDLDVVGTWDFVNDDPDVGNDPGEVDAQDRHGTGVAAVLAGHAPGDLVGAAPEVSLLLAKTEVITSETRVEEDHFVAALEWGEALGADVANASLGYRIFYDDPDGFQYLPEDLDGDTAVTTRAVDALVAMGVVAVTAAGNRGPAAGSLLTPADADSSLTVAAVDSTGAVAEFSSRGPTADGRRKPDLAARGVLTRWASTGERPFGPVSGTSVAAPLVSGSVALLLEAHPDWSPGDVANALTVTASRAAAPDDAVGAGVIDAYAAVFDVEAPVVPLPFALLAPADGARITGSSAVFLWEEAVDLQTPASVGYRIEIGGDPTLAEVLATYEIAGGLSRSVFLPRAGDLWWRVVATDPGGHARASTVRSLRADGPVTAALPGTGFEARWEGPWPNPASGTSTLRLVLPRPARIVRLDVFDVAGRRVAPLDLRGPRMAGEWLVGWNGRDAVGRTVASGRYLIRAVVVESGRSERILTRSIVRVR